MCSLLRLETDPAVLDQVAAKYGPEYFALFLRHVDLGTSGPETEVGVLQHRDLPQVLALNLKRLTPPLALGCA